jgi:hypothetical protein
MAIKIVFTMQLADKVIFYRGNKPETSLKNHLLTYSRQLNN